MAYPDQQIGWSVEAKLLQQILKKLDAILTGKIKVQVVNPVDNPVKVDQV